MVETGQVMLFIGPSFVITVRHGDACRLAPVRAEPGEPARSCWQQGPWAVAYAVTDHVVDLYVEVADQVEADLDDPGGAGLRPRQAHGRIQQIYQMKRELVEFKRAVVPLQRPLTTLTASTNRQVPKEIRRYFRDVQDHLTRTVEQVNALRRPAQLDPAGPPGAGHRRPEQRHAQDRGLGRHRGRLDRDRRHLRHELRLHARDRVEVRLSRCVLTAHAGRSRSCSTARSAAPAGSDLPVGTLSYGCCSPGRCRCRAARRASPRPWWQPV